MDRKAKKKAPKAAKVLALALAALLLAGGGCWLWWRSLPPQRFAGWTDNLSSYPPPWAGELSMTGDEIHRERDGSGYIEYTLLNKREETGYYHPDVLTIDYLYQGQYHRVFPNPKIAQPMVAQGGLPLEPGESLTRRQDLPAKALAAPGHYRFCNEFVGWVEFDVAHSGEVTIGQYQYGMVW